jgi:DNA-binding IclR family transcriptional regulator
MVLDAISRGMKSVGKIAKVTRMDKAIVEMVVNDLVSQRLVVIAEKKGFFVNKERNND